MRVSRIGIVSQVLSQEIVEILHDIFSVEECSSVSFFLNPDLFEFLSKTSPNSFQNLQKESLEQMNVDCIVSIGGDGTILRIGHTKPEIPILSINKGRKGFMTEIEPNDVVSSFKSFFSGKFKLEEHNRIEGLIDNTSLGTAINEFVISSVDLLKPIDFRIFVDEILISSSLADGLIVATAIGSTGHCLSSGGCVLDPNLDNIEISWINPTNLAVRPIILNSSRDIKIRCVTRINLIKLVIDGQTKLEYEPPIEVSFRSSNETIKFFRLSSSLTRFLKHFNQ